MVSKARRQPGSPHRDTSRHQLGSCLSRLILSRVRATSSDQTHQRLTLERSRISKEAMATLEALIAIVVIRLRKG